jgi:2-polyprenyl-3-methyl-5-hydroxy-6-metoxy-1,4-benzoquinol methylase
MHFTLPLDRFQRRLVEEVLTRAGAPFDTKDGGAFRAEVRRTWELYRDERARRRPRGPLAALHHLDRALHARTREEYIDDPTLSDARRMRIVRGLDRLNRGVGAYAWIASALARHLRGVPPGEVKLLDVGSGHGAVPIRLAQRQRIGAHRLRVIGSDIAPAFVADAQRSAARARVAVEFRVLDALQLDQLDERFDVITCTQTVHHFPPDFLAELMARARANARHGVLFFDGRRSGLNLLGVAAVGGLAGADPLLVHDGVVSIRRMYSPAELELLARCAPGGEAFRARNFGLSYVTLEARTV